MYLAPGEVHVNHTGGRSPLVRLQELGLLGPGFTAVHLAGTDDEELEIAAATGICVVACQQSHLRLDTALCPIGALEARSVTVGLGTDSAVSVGALDVLAEARVAALVDGVAGRTGMVGSAGAGRTGDLWGGGVRDGSTWVSGAAGGDVPARGGVAAGGRAGVSGVGGADAAGHGAAVAAGAGARAGAAASAYGATSGARAPGSDGAPFDAVALSALRRATLGGATALGLSAIAGSIEVGKAADLVCLNLSALSCQPNAQRPADAIVFGATRNHVSDVWTSGRAVVSDGHLLTFDEQELLALAKRWAARLPTGNGS
jgi:cytosine/adenosine deaminase-related metal-dependent hydrolase